MVKGKGKRLNEEQRLEIIQKLSKPNPPCKRAIAREYDVSENSIRNIWIKRTEIQQRTSQITEAGRLNQLRASTGRFAAIEDELFNWIDAMRRAKLEVPPSMAIMKAKEIALRLNISLDEFKASWHWLANFRSRRGLGSMLLHGEGADVDRQDPVLLQKLDELYEIIKQYQPENVFNMDETGLFFRLLPRYTLLMPGEDVSTTRGKKKAKERVSLIVCSNATGTHKITCSMIGKPLKPACIVNRSWPIPYFSQSRAWMDEAVCWKWFNEVFYPSVRQRTGRPVLLLLDNAPGHFAAFERDSVKVVFFPPNCTSWKQPCDMGIIAALKKRYKYLYLADVLSFFDLDSDTKEQLRANGLKIRRGSAGVEYGNPAHLLDAARYVQKAWDSIEPESIKNCFRKAEIISEFLQDDGVHIPDPGSDLFDMTSLIGELKNIISSQDLQMFSCIDNEDSPEFIESVKEDVEEQLNNVYYDSDQDENYKSTEQDLECGEQFLGFESIYRSLVDIGRQIQTPEARMILSEDDSGLMNAYETLSAKIRSKIMQLKRQRLSNQRQLTLHDYFQ